MLSNDLDRDRAKVGSSGRDPVVHHVRAMNRNSQRDRRGFGGGAPVKKAAGGVAATVGETVSVSRGNRGVPEGAKEVRTPARHGGSRGQHTVSRSPSAWREARPGAPIHTGQEDDRPHEVLLARRRALRHRVEMDE